MMFTLRGIGVVAAIAALVWAYGFGVDAERARRVAEVATLNATHDADLAAIDRTNRDALATAQQATRDAERIAGLRIAAIDAAGTKALHEQQVAADRTIAGLRAGTIRLREQYAQAARPGDGGPSGGAGQAGTSPRMGDGPAIGGFGEPDVIAILGAARDGDHWAEQLRACQAIVRSDRGQ